MSRVISMAAVLALCAGLVAGCGGGEEGSMSADTLEGTPWLLESGIDLPQDAKVTMPTAYFDAGTVSGSTGCNRFSGTYTLDADALELGQLAQTQMACAPPADRIEQDYVAKLGKVAGWSIEDDRLVLVGEGDVELLRYRPATPEGDWVATGMLTGDAFSSLLADTEVTARFAADGALSGSAGCNRYSSAYTVEKGTIVITPPAGTKKACAEPAGVMEQEATYLGLLSQATHFQTDGSTLELVAADGTRLVSFARSAAG